MKKQVFEKRSRIKATAEELFRWHDEPGALERLTPPGERVRVEERTHGALVDGSRVVLRLGRTSLAPRWVAEHRDVVPGRQFKDVMIEGPFAHWEHLHLFEPEGARRSWLVDRVEYALPFGWFGRLLGGWYVRRRLRRMFEWRHEVTVRDFEIVDRFRAAGSVA